MFQQRHLLHEDSGDVSRRQTASLAGVAVILALLVGGLFLVQQLRAAALLQDCLMSGRRNCDTVLAVRH